MCVFMISYFKYKNTWQMYIIFLLSRQFLFNNNRYGMKSRQLHVHNVIVLITVSLLILIAAIRCAHLINNITIRL